MNLARTHIEPSTIREPFFDGADLESTSYTFICTECDAPIDMECNQIYKGAWHWKDDFANHEIEQIQNFYNFGSNNFSLSGGWPSVTKHNCLNCNTEFILVADFHEYRNSVYKIVIQGIAKNEI